MEEEWKDIEEIHIAPKSFDKWEVLVLRKGEIPSAGIFDEVIIRDKVQIQFYHLNHTVHISPIELEELFTCRRTPENKLECKTEKVK